MKSVSCKFNSISFLSLSFILLFSFSIVIKAQNKPIPLKSDANSDDKQLCSDNSKIKDSDFCVAHTKYYAADATEAEKVQARNDMIDLLSDQIETYYKQRKDSRKTTNAWLQTIFDILEIGGSTAISITNGARPKSVIAAAINGFQAGRTSLNNNFELLQTQVLINKMNENRAKIQTEVADKITLNTTEYSWYKAKKDMRRLLYAGTFSDALDSLVKQTGDEATNAENTLRIVSGDITVLPESSATDVEIARNANKTLDMLKTKFSAATTKDAALATLKNILNELNKNTDLQSLITPLLTSTDAGEIISGLIGIRRAVTRDGKIELARTINNTINTIGNK